MSLPSTASDPRQPLGVKNGSATFLIALASLMMANLAPFIMTVLAESGFDIIESGNILTWALLASAVVGLATSRLAAGLARRRLAAAGLAVATIAFIVAAVFTTPALVVTGLIVGGAGIGSAVSTSGAAIAALRNPNRVSAASGLVNRTLVMIILAVIPLIGLTQMNVFGALALISAIGLALAMWLPDAPEHAAPAEVTTSLSVAAPKRITIAGIAILIIFPLWGTSEDAIWTLAPELGTAVGLGEQQLGFSLSLAAAGGILGMLAVTIFGNKLGRALPLTLALIAGGGIKVAIGFATDPIVLAALIIAVNTVYAFAFALFIATAAGLDARGRWSGPLIAAYLVGSSFAPLIGAMFIEWFGITTFSVLMAAVSFLVIVPTVMVARVSVGAEIALAREANREAVPTNNPAPADPAN